MRQGLLRPAGAVLAVAMHLSDGDVMRAIALARASDAERARFHAAYTAVVRDATVDRIELITEFRRAVLLAEERHRLGDRMFGVKQIGELLQPWRGRINVRAELRFHPQNAYVRVPDYEFVLGGPGSDALSGITARQPIYQLAPPRGAPASAPILGAYVETGFEAAALPSQPTLVRLMLDGDLVAMTTFDLNRLE